MRAVSRKHSLLVHQSLIVDDGSDPTRGQHLNLMLNLFYKDFNQSKGNLLVSLHILHIGNK